MKWNLLEQYSANILAICLIVRIVRMRVQLKGVYGVLCAFLGFQLLESGLSLAEWIFPAKFMIDYRISWMAMRTIAWVISLWMVYALLTAILKELPGILRFSKGLLNVVFGVAALATLFTVRTEYAAAHADALNSPIVRMLIGWFVLDRAVSTIALIALLSILAFILWFPVQMPRNLPILSSGLVIYFAAKTALWLIRNYLSLSEYDTETIGIVMNSVLPLCMVYWLFFLTPAGATEEVRTGHSWRLEEQARLMGQLESMNAMLLRSARR